MSGYINAVQTVVAVCDTLSYIDVCNLLDLILLE